MNNSAKSINLLLNDGTLQGVITVEDSSWNSGVMFSSPRKSLESLLQTDACDKYGAYLLIAPNRIYVGQSSDLAKRISQHVTGKDWWQNVVVITTKDDSLTHADIDYLESTLIRKARSSVRVECDNKNRGNPVKIDRFRRVYLEQYLQEALFLMQLIGINVFNEDFDTTTDKHVDTHVPRIDVTDKRSQLLFGKKAKSIAIEFLGERGIEVGKHVTYSTLQTDLPWFWLNPSTRMLSSDWSIILNDNISAELIVLKIPANTIALHGNHALKAVTRKDKPTLIDLRLDRETLVDKASGTKYSSFIHCRVRY